CCAPTAATCCRPACPSARRTWSVRSGPTPASPATWRACSRRASSPRPPATTAAASATPRIWSRRSAPGSTRSRASMTTASCAPKPVPAGPREEVQAEVVACYQTFIRGLLDLTDNIVAGRIVPPAQLVRRDGDDAYLVVAADKGTATFSDIANAIAGEYGFWL